MALDLSCGLCSGEARWQVEYMERHTGACSEHLAWACSLLQSGSHMSTVVEVHPTPLGVFTRT
jgi:hypothetical protein